MIRPATLVTMLLAAGSGLYLYQVKHQAQLLDEQIGHILKETDRARQRTGELVAEYALLNDPSRLQELATAHLHLRPTEPAQFTSMADLGHRLPAVGAARPSAPEPLPDPVVALARLTPATAPAVLASLPAPVTTPRPAPRPRPPVVAQAPASQPGLYGAPVEQANLPPQRMPTRPQLFPPMLATAHAMRPYAPASDRAAAMPGGAGPAMTAAASVGSALGMARSLQAASVSP